ncbi:MAG TPA: hypothetical protein VGO47_05365, partial [Chlamydiales bacterium]|nr:hypothetical protein [Chlamydiales bacterium]
MAIEVNVEDPSGDVLLLTIYNFPLPFFADAQELDGIFPIGTLLAIREPYLKTSLLDASRTFIRVDSPTDIIFFNDQSNLLQDVVWKFPSRGPRQLPHVTALQCKLDGNKKFKRKLWLSAAMAYTKGLSLSPSHDLSIDLRLNRSEAYLKLGYLSAALADAQLVLSDKALPQHSIMLGKALLKAGKANYFQDKFKEALDLFMQLKNIPDGIAEAETWINKTHLRIAEQHNGEYDWYKMFKSSEVVGSILDVADYLGPIEVRNLGSCGHGRGMVASRDVSPGELLV